MAMRSRLLSAQSTNARRKIFNQNTPKLLHPGLKIDRPRTTFAARWQQDWLRSEFLRKT
jgi:hypothetical protein